MMTNKEIRTESWQLLWREGWLGRCIAAGAALATILCFVLGLVSVLYAHFGVETLTDFQKAQATAASAGLGFTAPSQAAALRMCSATLFEYFLQYLFSGLAMMGVTAVLLKAIRRDATGWFGEAFVGFRMPLGVFWLWFRQQVQIGLWVCLVLFPCLGLMGGASKSLGLSLEAAAVVASVPAALVWLWAVYRYGLCWFFKADSPELRAGQCLRNSINLMKGQKMRAVRLDCSYWPWFLLMAVPLAGFGFLCYQFAQRGLGRLTLVPIAVGAVSLLALLVLGVVIGWWISLAHAIFYRDLTEAQNSPNAIPETATIEPEGIGRQ